MRRFFVEQQLKDGGVTLAGGEHHHLCNVLRTRVGDDIILVCGDTFDYHYKVTAITKNNSTLSFIKKEKNKRNPDVNITAYMGAIKPDALAQAVTALNEIGVSDLYIFKSDFSQKTANIEKLNSIAKQSCKQCERSIPLRVHGIIDFTDIPNDAKIVIGPEGGFSENEKSRIKQMGADIYLGKRILRSETAIVAACVLAMTEAEKWSL